MGRHAAKGLSPVDYASPGSSTTAVADLQLILHRPRLLVACFAAAIVPFAVYFAVIVMAGKLVDWPLFLFAPMVLAGVVIGALLDRAYARVMREA